MTSTDQFGVALVPEIRIGGVAVRTERVLYLTLAKEDLAMLPAKETFSSQDRTWV